MKGLHLQTMLYKPSNERYPLTYILWNQIYYFYIVYYNTKIYQKWWQVFNLI